MQLISTLKVTTFLTAISFLAGAHADFFEDNFSSGSTRTEYSIGEGQSDDLTLWYVNNSMPGDEGCLWDVDTDHPFSGCPGRRGFGSSAWAGTLQRYTACNGDTTAIGDTWEGCVRYDQSPYFELNNPGSNYWVLHANSDPSFDQCNPGPPGISYQTVNRFSSASGLFKVGMDPIPLGGGYAAHLKIDMNDLSNPCNEGTLPFLSIGAQKDHGNSSNVGILNTDASTTTLDKLHFKFSIPSISGISDYAHAGIFAIAEWDYINPNNQSAGKYKRMLLLDIFTTDPSDPDQDLCPNRRKGISCGRWNWPIFESMFWPGADIAVLTAGTALNNSACSINLPRITGAGHSETYTIDMSELFECAANTLRLFDSTMPEDTNIALTGVHWFVETQAIAPYSGAMEISIEEIDMGF